ncbi:substrate-binding periplasmic protein [Pontitalea aquivivens]|uniref:substrate-binding periplasmic protein n=1 Tax=Pontitalea aquivivens TaxID=3388663 RepID=UPI00397058D2
MSNFRAIVSGLSLAATLGLAATAASAQEASWARVQEAGTLRCGAAVYPPFVSYDPLTKEYGGLFAELCKRYATEVLGVKHEFVDTTWDNIVAGLQAGKWDMSLALNHTPQRALAVGFSDAAIPDQVSLAYKKDNAKIPADAKSFADFDKADVTVIVTSGTYMDKAVTALAKNARILRLPSGDEARLALMSGRGDVLADPSDSNMVYIAANSDWATHLIPEPAVSRQGMGLGVHRSMSHQDLQSLNFFLEELRATGQMDVMLQAAIEQILAEAN